MGARVVFDRRRRIAWTAADMAPAQRSGCRSTAKRGLNSHNLETAKSMNDPVKRELAVLEVDRNNVLRTEAALEHELGDRIFDLLLNRAL